MRKYQGQCNKLDKIKDGLWKLFVISKIHFNLKVCFQVLHWKHSRQLPKITVKERQHLQLGWQLTEAAVQTMVTPFPCSYWILSVKCLTLSSEYKHHYHPKNKNKKHTQHPYVLKSISTMTNSYIYLKNLRNIKN